MTTISFGRALKIQRIEKGYRQVDLARIVGVAENTLSKLETDRIRPSDALLDRLAKALDVSTSFLKVKRAGSYDHRAL